MLLKFTPTVYSEFMETLQELAKMAGIDLSQFSDEKEFISAKEKSVLLNINKEAMLYFHKKGIVQEMIHKLKYKGHQEIGVLIGDWYSEELKFSKEIKTIDYIVPVPLHKKRLKERGYNQVTTFGKALSTNLNIPFNDTILVRNVYSKTQTKKTFLGRSDVVESVFGVNFDESLHYKHFLLLDDVITTGATLEACCREMLKIRGAKVSIVCMAMTQ